VAVWPVFDPCFDVVFMHIPVFILRIFALPVGVVAKYCDKYVCVCVSVCPWGYLCNHSRNLYQIFVHVAYGRGSIVLQCRCDTLCTSDFVDDIMFLFYNWPYSSMIFASNDLFCLNLLIYHKIGHNLISYY